MDESSEKNEDKVSATERADEANDGTANAATEVEGGSPVKCTPEDISMTKSSMSISKSALMMATSQAKASASKTGTAKTGS